jgi:hypothetical protein
MGMTAMTVKAQVAAMTGERK